MAELTLVTVVYEPEMEMLRHQARSLARFGERASGPLLVIDNTTTGIRRGGKSRLVDDYGPLGARVEIVRRGDVAHLPLATGWRGQQVLKLAVADLVQTSHYLVLDAKNHWVRNLDPTNYVSTEGRSLIPIYSFAAHPLRPSLELTLRYLGLDPSEELVASFSATTTPFPMDTRLVRRMMGEIEERSGRDFGTEFLDRDLTEFFLYGGWLRANARELSRVDWVPQTAVTLWPGGAGDEAVVQARIAAVEETRAEVFSVHRAAYLKLTDRGRFMLAEFWSDQGIYENLGSAYRHVDEVVASASRWAPLMAASNVPARVKTLVRRNWGAGG